jgi:hypothetical protein
MTVPSANQLLTRPFEVHFSRLGIKIYQFMSAISPTKLEDITAVEMNMGNAFGVTFRCENKSGAELLCTIGNDFLGVVPCWLQMIEEQNFDVNWTENYTVKINGEKIAFIKKESNEDDEESHLGSAFAYYIFDDNQDPDYLVLDADESRLKISQSGNAFDDDGNELDDNLVFDQDELEGDDYDLANDSFSNVVELSNMESVHKNKEVWINNELSKFLKQKKIKLANDSE